MSTTPSSDRRFILALTTAVASATLAIGVTTGALLGWIGPRTTPSEPGSPAPDAGSSQLVYVPITPAAPRSPASVDPASVDPASVDPATASESRLALAEPGSHRDDHDDHKEDDDD